MIETPASAVISDVLAAEADFFSIGTNDLIQYTLAIDRQNDSLASFCDTHHEAILRLIKMTCDNAHRAGIWCGICGSLAADLALTKTFVEMGLDELSVEPSYILKLRSLIREY
jgi:phosphotransferase system enzyme I (PtsI)